MSMKDPLRVPVAALKATDISTMLRSCNVPAKDVLRAKSKDELVDLAAANDIHFVPDQWTGNLSGCECRSARLRLRWKALSAQPRCGTETFQRRMGWLATRPRAASQLTPLQPARVLCTAIVQS
jgi:hypothetical protein